MARSDPLRERDAAAEPTEIWLVDGYNVLHAGILRGRERRDWWTASGQARAVERIARFDGEGEIWVVFDRREKSGRDDEAGPEVPEPAVPARVQIAFAPCADDWIARRVRTARDPERVAVVTADRRLAGRVRHHGARVVSPTVFLARCPAEPAEDAAADRAAPRDAAADGGTPGPGDDDAAGDTRRSDSTS